MNRIKSNHQNLKLGKTTGLLWLLLFLILPVNIAHAEEQQKIKVALPIQPGFMEVNEDGELSGYTYEFLQKIAQYTGWEYELKILPDTTDESILTTMDWLKNGKIDLIGSFVKYEGVEKEYDIPFYNYGISYTGLYISSDNQSINETNYMTASNFKIAVIQSAENRNTLLKQFCKENNMQAEFVYCDSEEEQLKTIEDKTADAIIFPDISAPPGLKMIAKFAPTPYYFATTKGNIEIVNQLNYALININHDDPYFQVKLYEKYFDKNSRVLVLSKEEKNYINRRKVIRILVAEDAAPFQYFDEDNNFKGISKNVLQKIAEETGLRFQYIRAASHENLRYLLNEKKVDAIVGIPYDYEFAANYDVLLSQPYAISQTMAAVGNTYSGKEPDEQLLVLPAGAKVPGDKKKEQILFLNNLKECIEAVNQGEADYTYGNLYSIEYYYGQMNARNIQLIPQVDSEKEFCIGIAKPADKYLVSIVNKTIRSISDSELNTIIFQNIYDRNEKVSLYSFIDSNPRESIFIVLLIAAVLILITFLFLYTRLKTAKCLAIENKKYLQLADISNELIYEYDFRKDCLTLSEKSSDVFQCGQTINDFTHALDEISDSDESNLKKQLKQHFDFIKKEPETDLEIQMLLPDKELHWFRIISKIIYNSENRPVYIIGKLSDINKEKMEQQIMMEKIQIDGLTGIYNAASCRTLIKEYLASQQMQERNAVCILDIDHFKMVNDTFGHIMGDDVLKGVAADLVRLADNDSIIGRLGGDEFIICLKHVQDKKYLEDKCKAIGNAIHRNLCSGDKELKISVSIGAVIVEGRQDFLEVYKQADFALYQTKENGRDSYTIL